MLQTTAAIEEANIQESVETVETTEEIETEGEGTSPNSEEDTQNKGAEKAKKLLSQRNEARKEAEELKQRLEALEGRFQKEDEQKINAQKEDFKANYGDDALAKAEEKQKQIPGLSLEEAYLLTGGNIQKNPNRYAFTGRTPDTLKQNKSISELSSDELAKLAAEELRSKGFGL